MRESVPIPSLVHFRAIFFPIFHRIDRPIIDLVTLTHKKVDFKSKAEPVQPMYQEPELNRVYN